MLQGTFLFGDLSTLPLIASQMAGTSCHSSIHRGELPSSTKSWSISAILLLLKLPLGFARKNWLLEWNMPVLVLLHHFGPSISKAPNTLRWVSILLSMTHALYSGIFILFSYWYEFKQSRVFCRFYSESFQFSIPCNFYSTRFLWR